MAKHNNSISEETQNEAMAIAKKTQKPGQSKEQTKLIAQGIQKGIAEYKKSAKNKLRQADKAKKKKQQQQAQIANENSEPIQAQSSNTKLPWGLLILSWVLFGAYFFTQG